MRFRREQIVCPDVPLPHFFDHPEVAIYIRGIARKNTGPFAGIGNVEYASNCRDRSDQECEEKWEPERTVDLQDR